MIDWLWGKFVEQLTAIWAAPLPFGIALVISSVFVAFATFKVVVWNNTATVKALNQTISYLKERLEGQPKATPFPVDKAAEAKEVAQEADLRLLPYSDEHTPNSNDIDVKATRAEWWYSNIQSVIRDSEKLVVMDSVFGHNHPFWEALLKRFDSGEPPFHLVYLMLRDDNPFLQEILKLVNIKVSLTGVDRDKIAELQAKVSPTKTLQFRFWEGISPGPLIAWTKDGEETIGLGFWMHLTEATDGTPYVIVKRGPLFTALKRHYEAIIHKAKEPSRLTALWIFLKQLLKRAFSN